MKRFLIATLLCLVIVLSFVFVALKYVSTGPDNNSFNKNWRSKFAENPFLRRALSLHYDGDANSDYLGPRYSRILIEVDSMEGVSIPLAAIQELVKNISAVTGKNTGFIASDDHLVKPDLVDLRNFIMDNQDYSSGKDRAVLHLVIVNSNEEDSSFLGKTINDDTVVLYYDMLSEVTSRNPELFKAYFQSTALHEFGHQLGLGHNKEEGCLMNEAVEEFTIVRQDLDEVVSTFCDFELEQIQDIKSQYN